MTRITPERLVELIEDAVMTRDFADFDTALTADDKAHHAAYLSALRELERARPVIEAARPFLLWRKASARDWQNGAVQDEFEHMRKSICAALAAYDKEQSE